jgi:hypothetical protein
MSGTFLDHFAQHLALEIAREVAAALKLHTTVAKAGTGARFYQTMARNPVREDLRVTVTYQNGQIYADVGIVSTQVNYGVESTQIAYDPNDPGLIDEIVERSRRVLKGEKPHEYRSAKRAKC